MKQRELDFHIIHCELKNAYGITLARFENTNTLPVNTKRDYYNSNLGILYIHDGKGKLPFTLALQPLLHLKQALLHTDFINELDKALIGEPYNVKKFQSAIHEFLLINDLAPCTIKHHSYNKTLQHLMEKIA